MKVVAHGTVQGKVIVFPDPLGIPDGTRVVVSIEAENSEVEAEPTESLDEIMRMPFFGMWADRKDMAGSVAWVRRIHEQWRQQPNRATFRF